MNNAVTQLPRLSSFYINGSDGALSVDVEFFAAGISDLLVFIDTFFQSALPKKEYQNHLNIFHESFIEIVNSYIISSSKYSEGTLSSEAPIIDVVSFVDPDVMIAFFHEETSFNYRASSSEAIMQGAALFLFCMYYWDTKLSELNAESASIAAKDIISKYGELFA